MKLFTYSIFLCFLIPEILLAQQDLTSQLPKAKRYDPKEVIDEEYGINLYEKLNIRLSSDSVRNCKGYACSGWVEDYYTNGAVLHKGYYIDGQLKIYKNFYPNGNVEREYKIIDDYKSNMKKYYENGTLKSDIKYTDKESILKSIIKTWIIIWHKNRFLKTVHLSRFLS
jgi:antitoxin component YwqK of YwqJK toxin-antitoxin module